MGVCSAEAASGTWKRLTLCASRCLKPHQGVKERLLEEGAFELGLPGDERMPQEASKSVCEKAGRPAEA